MIQKLRVNIEGVVELLAIDLCETESRVQKLMALAICDPLVLRALLVTCNIILRDNNGEIPPVLDGAPLISAEEDFFCVKGYDPEEAGL